MTDICVAPQFEAKELHQRSAGMEPAAGHPFLQQSSCSKSWDTFFFIFSIGLQLHTSVHLQSQVLHSSA